MKNFPINPFEDIAPTDFNKLNKKNVTEDFVEENFRKISWDCYKPFTDTGIDRIITKFICPDNHTAYDKNLKGNTCPVCNKKSIEITRFLQIKTRELKNNIFGFTLKSKDIRIDPRHTYLLYSDKTTSEQQDFLIIPIYNYLNFFFKNNINPFSSTSFRKGNNKLNDLRYDSTIDKFYWGSHSWENFRNIQGLKLLQNSDIDINLYEFIKKTRKIANHLLNTFSRGRTFSEEVEQLTNATLKDKINLYQNPENVTTLRANIKKHLDNNIQDVNVKESMNKYFLFIQQLETAGETDKKGKEK